jgi:hypothetical protein
MRKDIKGKTVRVILGERADHGAIERYGDIWEVMSIGEKTAVLFCDKAVWTPYTGDIKEVELEDNKTVPLRNLKIKHKYKSFLFT